MLHNLSVTTIFVKRATVIPLSFTLVRHRMGQGMTYTVRLHGVAVGRSTLERLDPEHGFARGAFQPASGYQLVQDVFSLYAEAVPETPGGVVDAEKLARYYKARDALRLALLDAKERAVPGTTIHIYPSIEDTADEAFELEVHISDPGFWRARKKESGA